MTEFELIQARGIYSQIVQQEHLLKDLRQGGFSTLIPDADIRAEYIKAAEEQLRLLNATCSKAHAEQAMLLKRQCMELSNGLRNIARSSQVFVEGDDQPYNRIDIRQYPEIYQIMYNLLQDKLEELQKQFETL